jgi:hypothetical protein
MTLSIAKISKWCLPPSEFLIKSLFEFVICVIYVISPPVLSACIRNTRRSHVKKLHSPAPAVGQSVQRRDKAVRPGFNSRKGKEIFLFTAASRPAQDSTQPPNQ